MFSVFGSSRRRRVASCASPEADALVSGGAVSNEKVTADVLVIGSGAAGAGRPKTPAHFWAKGAGGGAAAVTTRLAHFGAKVVCLEQGDWRRSSDYPSSGSDYEAQLQ